jgi:hypothetical protein
MSKTKIQIARLEKLATHLESGKLGHAVFSFATVNEDVPRITKPGTVKGCGTVGCAMGECPIVFKKDWKFDKTYDGIVRSASPLLRKGSWGYASDDAAEFFGVDSNAIDHLFFPESQDTDTYGGRFLGDDATRKDVARNICAFVKLAKAGKIPNYNDEEEDNFNE